MTCGSGDQTVTTMLLSEPAVMNRRSLVAELHNINKCTVSLHWHHHSTQTSTISALDKTCPHQHCMRQSVPLRGVSCTHSKVGLKWRKPNVQSAPATLDLPALPPASKDDAKFWRFYLLWPWPVAFQTENWHATYLCHGERLCQFWFFLHFCFLVTRPYGREGQTHRWTSKTQNVAHRMAV